MAKRPTNSSSRSAGIPVASTTSRGRLRNSGIIDNAPDEQAAIARAIEEYQVPPMSAAGCWRGGETITGLLAAILRQVV